MTTIAFRDGILAADTQISYTSFNNGRRPKISKFNKFTVALAGLGWLRIPLERWVAAGCPEDKVPVELLENDKHFTSLIIDNETGEVFEFDNGYLLPVMADYTAIGSGGMLALGAMAHGATAEEAVAAASRHDKNTGGPVTSLSFPLAA